MIIKSATFIGSFTKESQCPEPSKPEYAFIGRSNVGKSSLINMLTNKKGLAKVSNTPGKTQTINYFLINADWYLVDLPGYGYAQTSKKNRADWKKMIDHYILTRETLLYVFLLIDGRIPLQKNDQEFMNWLGKKEIPFVIVYTKNDKPKKTKKNIVGIERDILKNWSFLPINFTSSSTTKMGRDVILQFIDTWNREYYGSRE